MSNITGHEQCIAALEALGQHANKQLEELSAATVARATATLESFAAEAQRIQDQKLAEQKAHYEKLMASRGKYTSLWSTLLGISFALNIVLMLLLVKR